MATQLGVFNSALRHLGEPALVTLADDVESQYVLSTAWDDAIVFMLRQAPWRFALKTESVAGVTSALISGYDHSFTKPATWLRTHSIFRLSGAKECPIDFKEQGAKWYANIATLIVRHVSTDGNVLSTWTEQFAKALSAYLAFLCCDKITGDPSRTQQVHNIFQEFLRSATDEDAIQEDPWLQYQMDGSFITAVDYLLEEASWKHAIDTVSLTPNVATPSPGYTYAFDKPAAWIRTVEVYYALGGGVGSGRQPIDYRDEEGDLHANYSPIVLRYLSSTLGRDSTTWTDTFRATLLAYLALQRVMGNPETPGAVLQARQFAYERAFGNSRSKDDERERPRVLQASRLTSARMGGSTNYQREQGWG